MELRRVKPDDILVPEVRVTAKFDDEMWEQFRASMKDIGAIAPIICIEVDGKLHLVDGLHRLIEARNNGEPEVNVAVIPGDEVDVLTKNLFIDHMRGKPPVTDMIRVIKELTVNYQQSSEDIAVKTGLTRDYVEKLQKLGQLTPLVLAGLDDGRIGVGQAHELTRLTDPVMQEAVYFQVEANRWKGKELHDYISDVIQTREEHPPAPEEPAERAPVKLMCHYCRELKDIRELSNPHTCHSCELTMLAAIAQATKEAEAEARSQNE